MHWRASSSGKQNMNSASQHSPTWHCALLEHIIGSPLPLLANALLLIPLLC
jgi:hypothetical protein